MKLSCWKIVTLFYGCCDVGWMADMILLIVWYFMDNYMSGYMLELFLVPTLQECVNPDNYNCTLLIEIYIFLRNMYLVF